MRSPQGEAQGQANDGRSLLEGALLHFAADRLKDLNPYTKFMENPAFRLPFSPDCAADL